MSRPPSIRRVANGFTLLELMISLVVVLFFTIGAMALLKQQQRSFQNTASDRALQETARAALSHMGENLRRAGYGIEPVLAFDFGPLNIPTATPIVTQSSGVSCRDGIGPNGSDELVFYSRDPSFGRPLTAAPVGGALTISGGLRTPIYLGQILQVMCAGAADWAYVTVGTTAAANWTGPPAAEPASTAITLGAGNADDFPVQNARLARTCFNANPASVRAFKIDRFRYYIGWAPDPETPNGRPYLMLDRGLTGPNGAIPEPVAPDVEDLQVAYVFPNATGGPATVGDQLGVPITDSPASIQLNAIPPLYNDPPDLPTRNNRSPANIRAVKVSVVTRTPGSDPQLADIANISAANQSPVDYVGGGNLVPGAGNRGDQAGDSHHHRLRVEASEGTRNLDSRVPYAPPYTTNGGLDGLNVGGG